MKNRPTPVASNILKIPEEFLEVPQDLIVSMDGLTVKALKFLSAISHELYYRTAQYGTKPVASIYKGCMDELLEVYKKGGFNITEVHFGNEFRKVMDQFLAKQDPTIKMNYAAAQEHVPRAEQNNRIIQ